MVLLRCDIFMDPRIVRESESGNCSVSEPIVVLGSGGHAKVVIEAIRQAGFFEIVACLDDAPERLQIDVAGIPVQGDISEMSLQRVGVRMPPRTQRAHKALRPGFYKLTSKWVRKGP